MTRVVIVGAGPAGFAVAGALLESSDVTIDLIDRDNRPDALLRHGPSAGTERLRDVARQVDAVLGDSRVTYHGGVEVGDRIPVEDLRSAADAVVLASGGPHDLPLDVAGSDSVGVGTLTHVEAWLAGSPDAHPDELDLAMDTALLVGISPRTLGVARVLCGEVPDDVPPVVAERLRASRIRHVQMVDPRPAAEVGLPDCLPGRLVVRTGLQPLGVVGRNRARALRCIAPRDSAGRLVTEDLRAQLLLRPQTTASRWRGFDEQEGHIANDGARVLVNGVPQTGLYTAGWAAHSPGAQRSHRQDAAAVAAAIRADLPATSAPGTELADVLARHGVTAVGLGGWSAVAATAALLDRFATEGTLPIADYGDLLENADDD